MGHIKKTLSNYANSEVLRLHMPGHKGSLDPLDNTEIPQTDNINNPENAYIKAQRYIGDVYNSKKSFFLTTGATLGVQAMVLYAKLSGYKIVAMRNSHMSVFNACMIFGVEYVFLNPIYDEDSNTYICSDDVLCEYLLSAKEKCAVIVTSPDYFGRCSDLGKIKNIAQKAGAIVLCDNAHGSHFVFSDLLPNDVSEYCDIWVNGAHKTLGALTQGAFVHCGESIDLCIFENILQSLNTSSPSHIIAASLEETVIDSKSDRWNIRAMECRELEDKINTLEYIKCSDMNWARSGNYYDKDVTRIVIEAKKAGGGFYLYKKLYNDYNIQLEMCDFRYLVAIMTIYDERSSDLKLYNALCELDVEKEEKEIPKINVYGERDNTISDETLLKSAKYISLDKAVGKISAHVLGAYPPGTAMVLPGEVILKEHVNYITLLLNSGGYVFGLKDGNLAIVDI